jgi:hypothetical protein
MCLILPTKLQGSFYCLSGHFVSILERQIRSEFVPHYGVLRICGFYCWTIQYVNAKYIHPRRDEMEPICVEVFVSRYAGSPCNAMNSISRITYPMLLPECPHPTSVSPTAFIILVYNGSSLNMNTVLEFTPLDNNASRNVPHHSFREIT